MAMQPFPDVLTIENLPAAVSEQTLTKLFEPFGAVDIHRDGKVATVHFVIGYQANKAFATLNTLQELGGAEFQCPLRFPESRTGLLINSLPSHVTEWQLFELFARFGPIYSCSVISKASSAEVTASIQFFMQKDAHMALQEMHCSDIDNQLISVSPMDAQSKRSSKQSTSSSSNSVDRPAAKPRTQLNVSAAPFNPSVGVASATHKEPISETENISPTLPKSILVQSQQQYIDYCNLYIKNLDEAVTSTDLFQHFKSFGRVVSARVIANAATNQSRGYGFVSYSRPDEAAYALNQMNGAVLGSKSILVAYHEPKKPRIMPLSPKSPDTSESGSQVLGLPPLDSPNPDLGDLYHDLYSSVVSSGLVWESNSQQVTEQLARLPRHEQVNLLTQPLLLIEKVKEVRDSLGMSPVIEIPISRPVNIRSPSDTSDNTSKDERPTKQEQTSASSVSSSLGSPVPQTISLVSLVATQQRRTSTPENITQRLGQDGSSTPGSSTPDQREKMAEAVAQVDAEAREEIIEMLMTLSSKERSLCIFNPDYLRNKIIQAREALEIFADEDERLSFSAAQQPIVHRAKDDDSAEAFYHRIANLSLYEQKQKLGDRLFPLVKATGIKQAPKVTIRLLDTIDLHRLSQIMTVDNPELTSLVKSTFESL